MCGNADTFHCYIPRVTLCTGVCLVYAAVPIPHVSVSCMLLFLYPMCLSRVCCCSYTPCVCLVYAAVPIPHVSVLCMLLFLYPMCLSRVCCCSYTPCVCLVYAAVPIPHVCLVLQEAYILNVPLAVISHVEKIGRSRSKGENAYGLEVFCKVHVHVYINVPCLLLSFISHLKTCIVFFASFTEHLSFKFTCL